MLSKMQLNGPRNTFQTHSWVWQEQQRPWQEDGSCRHISGGKGTAEEKFAAFEDAGIYIARDPSKIGEALVTALVDAGLRNS